MNKKYISHPSLGRFYHAAETHDFVFYCNYSESDENVNVIMKDRTGKTVTHSYFANEALFDAIDNGELTWMSPATKYHLKRLNYLAK